MNPIRLGTIGSGTIVRSVLDNVQRTEVISLAAVYSRSPEKGAALAAEYSCEKVYTDMDAFLADPSIDLIYIATPNLLHYEQAKRALEKGKHVLLEKPFTARAEQARELAEIARERRLFLLEAAPTSFLPNFTLLQSEIKKIGTVKLVMSNYSQYSSRYDALLRGEVAAVFDPAYAGGCLMDINFYNVLLNILLFGKPYSAVYHPNFFPGLCDISGVITLSYNGFVSTNAGAKDTWGVNFFQIEGENGYLYIEGGANGIRSVRTVTRDSDETINLQDDPDRYYYEVQEVVRLLQEEDYDAVYARLETTIATIETIEAARKGAGIFFPGD